MATAQDIKHGIAALYEEGRILAAAFSARKRNATFQTEYQCWYTRALPLVKSLAPDRYAEFRSYYEIDSTLRQGHWSHAYVIQHYLKGIDPFTGDEFDVRQLAVNCFYNQLAIFGSLLTRLDYALLDLEDSLQLSLQAAELDAARGLIKISARAAGALAGTVVENHLRTLARKHRIKPPKKQPTVRDFNDALHTAGRLDAQVHRQVAWLADMRDRCLQRQETRPTRAQVRDMVDSTHWLIKNVF